MSKVRKPIPKTQKQLKDGDNAATEKIFKKCVH